MNRRGFFAALLAPWAAVRGKKPVFPALGCVKPWVSNPSTRLMLSKFESLVDGLRDHGLIQR